MKTFEEKLQLFKNKIQDIYGNKSESIFQTHFQNRNKTFRLNKLIEQNTQKVFEMLKQDGIEFTETNVASNYIVTNEKIPLSKSNAFLKHFIYIQEVSSTLPVVELDVKENEKILDLCASPGSKTSLIQSITNNSSLVTAVEKNRNRFFKLKSNLTENGVINVNLVNADANRLIFIKPEFNNYFDKVLADVPCTTESKLNLNENTSLREWKLSNAKDISKLQKGLLNSAFKMLKRNGTLIYSTCTYSVEENEAVVDWFLKKNTNAKVMDINLKVENSVTGLVHYKGKTFNNDLQKSLRVLPDTQLTAFYIAKMTKL
jgi:NOL1/NOP2/sun family putative RNA methylase